MKKINQETLQRSPKEGGGEGKLLHEGGTDRDVEGSTKGPRRPKIASYFKIRSRKNQPKEPEMSDFHRELGVRILSTF